MTQVMEATSVTDWAKQWLADNRDGMVTYIVGRYPHLPVGKVEAMIDQLWDRLVGRIVKDHGCTIEEAERAQARGLDFLARYTTEGPSSPDQEQDRGWHNAILYTLEYEALCDILVGHFVHHLPNDVVGWSQAAKNAKCGSSCDELCRGCTQLTTHPEVQATPSDNGVS